jgi:hypothetical protein
MQLNSEKVKEFSCSAGIISNQGFILNLEVLTRRQIYPERATVVNMACPSVMCTIEVCPWLPAWMPLLYKGSYDIPAVTDNMNETGLRKESNYSVKAPLVLGVCIVGVLVSPITSLRTYSPVKIPDKLRIDRTQVTDKLVPIAYQALGVLR